MYTTTNTDLRNCEGYKLVDALKLKYNYLDTQTPAVELEAAGSKIRVPHGISFQKPSLRVHGMGSRAGTSSRLPDNITSALQPCQALTLVVLLVLLIKEKQGNQDSP